MCDVHVVVDDGDAACVELAANYLTTWPCLRAHTATTTSDTDDDGDGDVDAVAQWQRDAHATRTRREASGDDDSDDDVVPRPVRSLVVDVAAAWARALPHDTAGNKKSDNSNDDGDDDIAAASGATRRAHDMTCDLLTRLHDCLRGHVTMHARSGAQRARRVAARCVLDAAVTALQPLLQQLLHAPAVSSASASASCTAQRCYDALLPCVMPLVLAAATATTRCRVEQHTTDTRDDVHTTLLSMYLTTTTTAATRRDARSALRALLQPHVCAVSDAVVRELHYHFRRGMPTAPPHEPQHLIAFVHDAMVRLSCAACAHVQHGGRCCSSNDEHTHASSNKNNNNNDNKQRQPQGHRDATYNNDDKEGDVRVFVRALTALAQVRVAAAATTALTTCYRWRHVVGQLHTVLPHAHGDDDDDEDESSGDNDDDDDNDMDSDNDDEAVMHVPQLRYVVHMVNVLCDACARVQRTRATAASGSDKSSSSSHNDNDCCCCCCSCCSRGDGSTTHTAANAAAATAADTMRCRRRCHVVHVDDVAMRVLCDAVLGDDAVRRVYLTALRATARRAAAQGASDAMQWRRAYLQDDDDDNDNNNDNEHTHRTATPAARVATAAAAVVRVRQRCACMLRSVDAYVTRLCSTGVLTLLSARRALLTRLWRRVLAPLLREATDDVVAALSPQLQTQQQQQRERKTIRAYSEYSDAQASTAAAAAAWTRATWHDVATLRSGVHTLLLLRSAADAWRSQLAEVWCRRVTRPAWREQEQLVDNNDDDDDVTTRTMRDNVTALLSSSSADGVAAHLLSQYTTWAQRGTVAAQQCMHALCQRFATRHTRCREHDSSKDDNDKRKTTATHATLQHDDGYAYCSDACKCSRDAYGDDVVADVCALHHLLTHMTYNASGHTPRAPHCRHGRHHDATHDDDGDVQAQWRGHDAQLQQCMRAVAQHALDRDAQKALAAMATRTGHDTVAQLLQLQ